MPLCAWASPDADKRTAGRSTALRSGRDDNFLEVEDFRDSTRCGRAWWSDLRFNSLSRHCWLDFLDRSLQLATGGVDVSSSRPAEEGGNAARDESLLKGRHLLWLRHRVANAGTGIPGDQVYLHRHGRAAGERDQLIRMLQAIVDA